MSVLIIFDTIIWYWLRFFSLVIQVSGETRHKKYHAPKHTALMPSLAPRDNVPLATDDVSPPPTVQVDWQFYA